MRNPLKTPPSPLSIKRSFSRQVLDCGDGVREVTALALAALKMPKLAVDTATSIQSGDSEDSVAAVQDAVATPEAAGNSARSWTAPVLWRFRTCWGRTTGETWPQLRRVRAGNRRGLFALPTTQNQTSSNPNGIPPQKLGLALRVQPERTAPHGPTPTGLRHDQACVRRKQAILPETRSVKMGIPIIFSISVTVER
jgi:hypothetical protein